MTAFSMLDSIRMAALTGSDSDLLRAMDPVYKRGLRDGAEVALSVLVKGEVIDERTKSTVLTIVDDAFKKTGL